jgi:hypothetical protein
MRGASIGSIELRDTAVLRVSCPQRTRTLAYCLCKPRNLSGVPQDFLSIGRP